MTQTAILPNNSAKAQKSDGRVTAKATTQKPVPDTNDWVAGARRQLSELCISRGLSSSLTISRSVRGKVELAMKPRRAGNRIVLPFDWSEAAWGDCYVRIRNIFSTALQGYNLVEAANLTEARAPASQRDSNGS